MPVIVGSGGRDDGRRHGKELARPPGGQMNPGHDNGEAGFAALTMNKELGLTAEMFGFGVGIFFIGYSIFEVPSNLILEKVGARPQSNRSLDNCHIVV